jgi:hypothetical protein
LHGAILADPRENSAFLRSMEPPFFFPHPDGITLGRARWMPEAPPKDLLMRLSRRPQLVALFVLAFLSATAYAAPSDDEAALRATSAAIRSAFAKGDVAEAMKFHHPEVKKALGYRKVLIGRDAVAADLSNTFRQYHLEFLENNVESLLIEDSTAVEQTLFTIKVIPIAGGEPTLFKGRTQVVYVRYKGSPTGWASIREIIQSATD